MGFIGGCLLKRGREFKGWFMTYTTPPPHPTNPASKGGGEKWYSYIKTKLFVIWHYYKL